MKINQKRIGYEIAVSMNPGRAYQVQTLEQAESWKFMEYDPPLTRKEAYLLSRILLDKGWRGVKVFNPKGHMTFDGRPDNSEKKPPPYGEMRR